MAVRAVERRRRMAESFREKLFLFFGVARKAEILSLSDQAVRIRRAVRIVTRDAIAYGHRPVHFLIDRLVVDVALVAELAGWARFEPIAVR